MGLFCVIFPSNTILYTTLPMEGVRESPVEVDQVTIIQSNIEGGRAQRTKEVVDKIFRQVSLISYDIVLCLLSVRILELGQRSHPDDNDGQVSGRPIYNIRLAGVAIHRVGL